MKNFFFITTIFITSLSFLNLNANAQTSATPLATLDKANPWTREQLLEPEVLATSIKNNSADIPVIFNIGAVDDIKGAKHIGPVSDAANLEHFKKEISQLQLNKTIVIYCGCCPFTKCPNIRPAFAELKKLGFTQIKVLNLPVNLKTNWIAKGFPLAGA